MRKDCRTCWLKAKGLELNESPVDTVIKIRQDLAEFQRTNDKQEWSGDLAKGLQRGSAFGPSVVPMLTQEMIR